MNPITALQESGQSIWLDHIRRDLITGAERVLPMNLSDDPAKGLAVLKEALNA